MSICLSRDLNHRFITIFLGTICIKVCAIEIQFFSCCWTKKNPNNLLYYGNCTFLCINVIYFIYIVNFIFFHFITNFCWSTVIYVLIKNILIQRIGFFFHLKSQFNIQYGLQSWAHSIISVFTLIGFFITAPFQSFDDFVIYRYVN